MKINNEIFKTIRKEMNLNQEDFAKMIHVSRKTVSRRETGEAKNIRISKKSFR